MDYKTALKIYRNASGSDFEKTDKVKSYLRNDAWHLLSESGALLAVVRPDGTCIHGLALAALQRQLMMGIPAPRR